MIKILFCTSSFAGGGITSYSQEFISCFSDLYQLTIVIGDDKYSPIDTKKAEVVYASMEDTSIANARRLLSIIDEKKPDIVFNNNARLLSLITPCLQNGIKIISICHSICDTPVDLGTFNYGYVDKVIVLAKINKDVLLHRFSIRESKIEVIYNSLSQDRVDRLAEEKRKKKRLSIVYSGGCAPTKNPEYIIKVVKHLLKSNDNFDFYWLGNTKTPASKVCIIKDIKYLFDNDNRLHFTGRVPRKEAEEYSKSANIFLQPSRREGCPMALLEAMQNGAISIVTDLPVANKEMIEEEVNGFICDKNTPAECANLLLDIIRNHQKYAAIYEQSQKYYQSNFSKEDWICKMRSLFEDQCSQHKPRKQKFSSIVFGLMRIYLLLKNQKSYYKRILNEQLKTYLVVSKLYIKQKYGN